MARIIELTGPPGVGKTTFYENLVLKWKRKHNWTPAHLLYPIKKIRHDNTKTFFDSVIQKWNRKPDEDAFADAGRRFVAAYPEYVEATLNDVSLNKRDINGKDLRFHDADFLYESFKRVQVLLDNRSEKFALKAEGVVHRIPHNVYDDDLTKEREKINALVTRIPLPAALIYLTCDVEENAMRLATRRHVWEGHRNLSLNKLKDYSRRSQEKRNMIIEILHNHKVPILRVDTTMHPHQNIQDILAFMNTL